MFKKLIATTDDSAAFITRLALGAVMFPHGAQKALGLFGGYGFTGTVGFLTEKVGLPYGVAVLVICGEFLGSIGLIVGCLSRIAALGILAIMAGAIYNVHLANGFFMNWFGQQPGEGYEYHLLAIGLAIAVVIRGSGRWSIDRALSK